MELVSFSQNGGKKKKKLKKKKLKKKDKKTKKKWDPESLMKVYVKSHHHVLEKRASVYADSYGGNYNCDICNEREYSYKIFISRPS